MEIKVSAKELQEELNRRMKDYDLDESDSIDITNDQDTVYIFKKSQENERQNEGG